MTFDEFINASLTDLEAQTSISKAGWCNYFGKKRAMQLNILERTAEELGMCPVEFYAAFRVRSNKYEQRIQLRRLKKIKKKLA